MLKVLPRRRPLRPSRRQGKPVAQAAIAAAARWLGAGGLVIFPTETYYGLACDPRRPTAVGRLLVLKGRPSGKALPLIAGSVAQVGRVAPHWRRSAAARALAQAFWPGPLSLVLDGTGRLAPGVRARDGSIAIRCSPHPIARALARALDFPVVATSANRSGAPAPRSAAAAAAGLLAGAAVLVLDGGATRGGRASTIVDARCDPPRVLRRGAVGVVRVRAALRAARARGEC